MGLIKTAIMTGGGIYAVKQFAKTADRRRDSPAPNNQNYSRDGGYQHQGQRGPPGPPPRGPPVDNRYGNYQQQQQSYYNNDTYARGFSAGNYDEERNPGTGGDFQYEQRNRQIAPPSYYPQQEYNQNQNQYQNQEQSRDQFQSRGKDGSSVEGLMDMAMEFVGRGGGKNGKNL